MDSTELPFGIVTLLHVSIGVSVNVFLLLFYARLVSTSRRTSSSELILTQLALANTIILLTSGIAETLSAWGLRNFLGDVGCKILSYLYRVARGLAICTTCLLSVFQAVTVSPGTSRWAGVKAKLHRCIVPFCLLSWVLNMLVECSVAIQMTGPQNRSHSQNVMDHKYCSHVFGSPETTWALTVLVSLRDVSFVGLMSLASGYMVFVLHRHHRQVRHLHGPGRSPRVMPEVRAAKRVIALVTLYVLLYGRQTITLSILLNLKDKSPLLVKSHMVLSFTFSAVSPFLVIHRDQRIRMFRQRESADSHLDLPAPS
ncbi:vomeronasal 1 receptor ornAnaV1R3002 [Ornithorhynchus anatinus]|uniref:Vomeronasal type-1 receptor n=1 Tax=Ornithorhynchus anatinus TaxID=9258 RepID=A0A6I8NWU3_ORNAN|nr:vomeronasal 1 receptor ornAnaV1R3002 [Ornithorhynchus anatinus]